MSMSFKQVQIKSNNSKTKQDVNKKFSRNTDFKTEQRVQETNSTINHMRIVENFNNRLDPVEERIYKHEDRSCGMSVTNIKFCFLIQSSCFCVLAGEQR